MQSVSKFIITISLLIILFLPYSFAQDTTKSNLLESAKIRLGKGTLGEIDYFPDATRFAVATSIGVWIYDSITQDTIGGKVVRQVVVLAKGLNARRHFSV